MLVLQHFRVQKGHMVLYSCTLFYSTTNSSPNTTTTNKINYNYRLAIKYIIKMCKVVYVYHSCGHEKSTIFPHTPCEHHLANVQLSGLDPEFKQNLRLCRASRTRKVKTLEDDFCTLCDAKITDLPPRDGARHAQNLRELAASNEVKHRVWLAENVDLAQHQEDRRLEENVVDSQGSEMTDPRVGK